MIPQVAAIIGVMTRQKMEELFSDDDILCRHFSGEKLRFFGGNGPGDCEQHALHPTPP